MNGPADETPQRETIDFHLETNRFFLFFVVLFALCLAHNFYAQSYFEPRHTTWEGIVSSLHPSQARIATTVPSIKRVATALIDNGYETRAELVVRLYAGNWLILLIGVAIAIPWILVLRRRIARRVVILAEDQFARLCTGGEGRAYYLWKLGIIVWLARILGFFMLIIVTMERLDLRRGLHTNGVHRADWDLHRAGFLGGLCLALMLGSFILGALPKRIRDRGAADIIVKDPAP